MTWPLALQRYRGDLFLKRSKTQVLYEALGNEDIEVDDNDNMEMGLGVFNDGRKVWGLVLGNRFLHFVWTVDQTKSDDSALFIDGGKCVGRSSWKDNTSDIGNTGLGVKDIIDAGTSLFEVRLMV